MTELLKSSNELLASPEWHARIDEWNRSADGRIAIAAGHGRVLLDSFFRRVYLAIGLLFAMLVCYRVVSILLMRRSAIHGIASGSRRSP